MRLIDADEIELCGTGKLDYDGMAMMRLDDIHESLDQRPTVDAAPVVRCKDCIYRNGEVPGQPNILCFQMHDDDFCSYGVRKGGEG